MSRCLRGYRTTAPRQSGHNGSKSKSEGCNSDWALCETAPWTLDLTPSPDKDGCLDVCLRWVPSGATGQAVIPWRWTCSWSPLTTKPRDANQNISMSYFTCVLVKREDGRFSLVFDNRWFWLFDRRILGTQGLEHVTFLSWIMFLTLSKYFHIFSEDGLRNRQTITGCVAEPAPPFPTHGKVKGTFARALTCRQLSTGAVLNKMVWN